MKLYHYSKDLYKDLRTLKVRGESAGDKDGWRDAYKPGAYDEHISFFLERIPLDILGSIFKGVNHQVWYTGSHLYEYEVDVGKMSEFSYDIVESPLSNRLFYDETTDYMSNIDYAILLQKTKLAAGEIGYTKREFLKVAPQYIGILRQEYLKLPSRPNWDRLQSLYAGSVVHVMLYPTTGIVAYDHAKPVRVGGGRITTEAIPVYTKW